MKKKSQDFLISCNRGMGIPMEKGAQGMNKEEPKTWGFKRIPEFLRKIWLYS